MQQTLLALAAVLVFSLYALGRHQTDSNVDRRAMGVEAELAATDVALARMAALESLAFDEEDVERTGIRRAPPASGIGPDPGEATPLAYDDVDDWHGRTDTVSVDVGVDALRFAVATEVVFVSAATPDVPSATATLAKKIRVRATEISDRPLQRAPARVDIRRVVTPASAAVFSR